jgi:hypothetical protein
MGFVDANVNECGLDGGYRTLPARLHPRCGPLTISLCNAFAHISLTSRALRSSIQTGPPSSASGRAARAAKEGGVGQPSEHRYTPAKMILFRIIVG